MLCPPSGFRQSKGFTIIELVVVVVLMGIVSMAGVEIIRQSSEAYLVMSERQALGNAARLSVERLSRDLREALPGSVRVSGSCLEYVPILVAGRYFSVPVETPGTSMSVVPVTASLDASQGRVAVYPLGADVYDVSSGILSPVASLSAPDSDNVSALSWTGNHGFANRSPTNRFYMVDDPVSYCVDGTNLFRYSNYGVVLTQPLIADLPSGLPDRALLVSSVGASGAPFSVSAPGLSRNAMVEFNLQFAQAGEVLGVSHEVQLRNVP